MPSLTRPAQVEGAPTALDTSRNNFEKGATDVFLLKKHRRLGALTKLKIGHDGRGLAAGVLLFFCPENGALWGAAHCCASR